jgi:hypothetical protein
LPAGEVSRDEEWVAAPAMPDATLRGRYAPDDIVVMAGGAGTAAAGHGLSLSV